MKSIFDFVVEPVGDRYNNTKNIDGVDLILNTQIFTHQNVNRLAIVKSLPITGDTNISIGDQVIVHHNVFRRYHDVRGVEKNGKSYIDDDNYLCSFDQIFLYKNKNEWKAPKGYSFVKPIESNNIFNLNKELPSIGVVKYLDEHFDSQIQQGDLVGFTPGSEYEFIVDDERLYRVRSQSLTIRYEYQGDEKEYNPSWA
mgnify:FL=1|jgi:hypothetical protein